MSTLRTLETHRDEASPRPASDVAPAAPRPSGPLTGRRSPWRYYLAVAFHFVNRLVAPTPPGRWLQERLRRGLEFTEVSVPLHGTSLATELSIAFLTDLHAGFYHDAHELEELAERVMGLSPDLVCLGGDLVDARREEVLLLDGFLRRLEAPLGVFAVPGNHEYYPARGLDLWRPFLEERGVRVLVNRGERVHVDGSERVGSAVKGARVLEEVGTEDGGTRHGTVWVAGVDDLTESEPDLAAALEGRRAGEPTLLLSHHPDLFVEAAARGVHLQLSGHTHGGQIRLLGWLPLRHSSFGLDRGLFESGPSRLYVAAGVGTTVAPLRLNAPAEVTLVRWGGEESLRNRCAVS